MKVPYMESRGTSRTLLWQGASLFVERDDNDDDDDDSRRSLGHAPTRCFCQCDEHLAHGILDLVQPPRWRFTGFIIATTRSRRFHSHVAE